MAHIMNTSKVLLSHNEKIEDEEICKNLVSYTETPINDCNLKVIENVETMFLFFKIDLRNLQSMTTLTNLYIIRCSLDGEALSSLVTILKTYERLSLLYLCDNNPLHNDVLKLFEVLENSKHLTSVLVFEKLLSDISMEKIYLTISTNYTLFQVLLVSANKLLVQGASNHQILAALDYNPSVVHLQLNDCHITDEVMSKIAVILKSSSQQWSLLDLCSSKVDDDTLIKFCNAIDGNCAVDSVKLANNKLTSLSLIVELIRCLNPIAINICGNSFAIDDSNSASISMIVAEELFAHDNQMSLMLTCDDDSVLLCQKLTITGNTLVNHSITQIIATDCTVSGEIVLKSLDNNDKLTSLYLAHTKWSGEPYYNLTESFEKNMFLSICESVIPGEMLGYLVSKFDTDVNVSSIISSNDIFIANKCSINVLKFHLIRKLSSNVNLFYVRNCFLEHEPHNSNIISDYFSEQNMVTEIMLCNNGLGLNNVCRIIKTLKLLKMLKSIFICELQKQLHGTKVARYLFHIFNCSFIIMDDKVVIGNQANLEQLSRCLSLVPPSTTILRFINCSFDSEHYNTLVDVLSRNTTLEEFSLYECNTNDIWTKQLVEALQVKSAMTSLLLSCNKVTLLKADSIAIALSAVINSNPSLEKVSFKFDNLPSSACGKIFQALSNIMHLKHFRFCDGQVTTKDAIDQLYQMIANNSSLKVVNLRNNKLRSSGIKIIAKAFKNICYLKLLALNGNQIDEEAADDIASIIANNIGIEKLLLYDNVLKSEGIRKICQVLKNHRNLRVFRIAHNYVQEAADTIAEVISQNPLLKIVDIGNNRLLTEGVIKITSQLEKSTNLQKLYLNNNNITCTEKVIASLAKVIANNINLKSLHLDNNNFSVADISIIAEAVNKLTGLKELTVNNTGFTADHVSTMITNNLLLEILDIGDNKLKSEGVRNISKALMKLSHLRELGLYGNEITGDAAGDIAGVISRLPVLEKLQLNNNAFGVGGMQTICKSLQHNGTLKLLQLDNVGVTEEVADDIAAVIHSNPLLEYIYLGNNKLHSTGAKVILNSLKNKTRFKALALNNNCISEDVVDNVVQFVTSNPELEELLLNNNSIGTTGVIKICRCIKDINTLRIFNLTGNIVGDEATDALVSVIESNTALEKISLDDNMLFNNVSTIITKLSSLKCLHINCKPATKNAVYNFIFANSNIEEITLNYLVEEIHFLSPSKAIDTVVVIKANVSELASHMPALHSVVMKDKVEMVCAQDDVLLKSEVMKMITAKTFKRLLLVFTRMNCYTDQEINVLVTAIANDININLLTISNLNANKYNSDVSGIVIIEESEIIVMLTDGNPTAPAITKLIQSIISLKVIYTGSVGNFFGNEIVHSIFNMTQLKCFLLRNDTIHANAMESLTRAITIKTVKILNNLNIRNFDISQKNDELSLQSVDEIDNNLWLKIFCALKHKVDFKRLDLSGISINKEVAQNLCFLIDELANSTKFEALLLEDCSLGNNGLNVIANSLKGIPTLKHLDLSNNNITEDSLIVSVLEANTGVEKLHLHKNCLHSTAGDKLSVAIVNLKNLKELSIDQYIISRYMALKLTTSFSPSIDRNLFIYDHNNQTKEWMEIKGPLSYINTLTMYKHLVTEPDLSTKVTTSFSISETGIVSLRWVQSNIIGTSGILRFLSSLKQITTIELHNINGSGVTELEVDTIATVISENVQLENVWLSSYFVKSVLDDFNTFEAVENKISTEKVVSVSKDNTAVNKIPQLFPNKSLLKILYALQNITKLRTLNLSGNVITEELAEQLAIVLDNSTKLEVLLLGDCFLNNEGVNVITRSLKNITTLKHLYLCNNNITEELAIVNILKSNEKLNKLYLHKNCLQLSAEDNLIDNFVNLKCLKVLSIDQNIVSRNMAIKLANSYSLSTEMKLYIYDNDHQTTEVIKFRDLFKNINALTLCKYYSERGSLLVTLILKCKSELLWDQSNVLRRVGVVTFLSAISNITTIKVLTTSGIEFTELEVDTMATIISENVQLENLWLGVKAVNDALVSDSNTLFKESKQQTASPSNDDRFTNQLKTCSPKLEIFPCKLLLKLFLALRSHTNLKRLDFSGNVITEELAEQLAIVLANSTKLETLLLRDCSLGNEGVNVIANSLKDVYTLKHLNLSNNKITEDSVIVSMLEANTGVETLHLEQNCLDSTADDRLTVAIVNLKNLKELGIDQNIISRNMALKLVNTFYANTNGRLFIYNHDYQTTEVLVNKGSLYNINTLTLSKFSITIPLTTTVLETGTAILGWYQATALRTTGILKVFSAVNKISTIKLHKFDNELNELEVDTIAAIISDNVTLTNVWLGSHSHKVVYDDFDALTNEHNNDNVDCCKDLELLPPKVQLIPHTQLFKILLALKCNANLNTLDLSGNVITEELAEQLAIVLVNSTKLETLLLRDCSLNSVGINVVANSLKNITTLKQFSLSWDHITDVATDYVVTVIERNIRLEKLF